MNMLKTTLAVLALALLSQSALAGRHCCPDCGAKTCVAIPETKTEKKSCYKTECKDICIPKFRFPWQMCCTPKCGKVITVKVLKKVDYECKKCGYTWEINEVCSCTSDGCTTIPVEGPSDLEEPSPSDQVPVPPPVNAKRLYGKPVVHRQLSGR